MKILLAEDEMSLAKALVRILEKNNYYADAVHNGIDAFNYLTDGDYDAAIKTNQLYDGVRDIIGYNKLVDQNLEKAFHSCLHSIKYHNNYTSGNELCQVFTTNYTYQYI